MSISRFFCAGVAAVVLAGSAGAFAADTVDPAAVPTAPAATAPAPVAAGPSAAPGPMAPTATTAAPSTTPQAPTGSATVIFFRPSHFAGAAVGFIVREGTSELGKLRNGKFFTIHVTPGKHEYTVHSESSDHLTIDADPGETYYIQGGIGVGFVVGRPNISPSNQAAFEAVKAKLQEVPPLAPGE